MEYITTKEKLKEVALLNLGEMKVGGYPDAVKRASESGVDRPRLIIETELKEPSFYGLVDVVYPILEREWDEFAVDKLAKYTPVVYVVDGSVYTAPI